MDEALPLHSGRADPIDCPKCGQLGCVIFVSGGLRSRFTYRWRHMHSICYVTKTCDRRQFLKLLLNVPTVLWFNTFTLNHDISCEK